MSSATTATFLLDSEQHGQAFFSPSLQFISPSFAIFYDEITNVVGTAVLK